MSLIDQFKKSAQEIAGTIPKAAASTYEDVKSQASQKLNEIWGLAKKKVVDATTSDPIVVSFITPTPTPPPEEQKKFIDAGYQRIGQREGKDIYYRQNPQSPQGYDLVDSSGTSLKTTPSPTPFPRAVPKVLAAETDRSQFKQERDEGGPLGVVIKQVFPESEWKRVPVVLDGENGGRVANMAVDPKSGQRYYINDPQKLLDLAAQNQDKNGIDTGIMQINSKTFESYWNRQGNQAGTYPFREIMIRNGINSYSDMLDPVKNIMMGRIIWGVQGWGAWFGAPAEYKQKGGN